MKYFDGRAWKLEAPGDFTTARSHSGYLKALAKRHGIDATVTQRGENVIYVKATVPKDAGPPIHDERMVRRE